MYESEIAVGIRDATDKKFEEIQEEAKQQLRTERPVKFKISELANAAEEFVFKPAGTLMTAPIVAGLNTIESVYNAARKGVENDVDMKESFHKCLSCLITTHQALVQHQMIKLT